MGMSGHGTAAANADIGALLTPRSVAVIGASGDMAKFGGRVLKLLVQHGFPGAIYPINRSNETLLGLRCYPSIDATPTPPDMAVMAVPRDAVAEAVAACAAAGTRAAIVITARFSDAGPEGAALERRIVAIARRAGMRLIGPNCLGLISPVNRLVLCSSPALLVDHLPVGKVGLISQSGAMMATLFDRARSRGQGLSHAFSIGNQADLELGDYLDFLTADPATEVICAYVEGLRDPARFLKAARAAHAAGKPLLIVKAGRTEAGAAAAFSHTAALAGSFAAFEAACRSVGALVMDDMDAMLSLAASLAAHPARADEPVALVTPSGGAGAMAADRLGTARLPVATLGDATTARLAPLFPPGEPPGNPVDLGTARGDGLVSASSAITEALMAAPEIGAVLAPVTTAPDIRRICAGLAEGAATANKPLLVVLHPGEAANPARALLAERGVPYTDSLDEAVRVLTGRRAFAALAPQAMPNRPADLPATPPALQAGVAGEQASKEALAAYFVPVNRGGHAPNAAEAEALARTLTPPFALKIASTDITHKSDAGGVALDLATPQEVAEAARAMATRLAETHPTARLDGFTVQEMAQGRLEVLVGTRFDAQFGAVITVGAGGVLTELLGDVAVAIAPVDPAQATAMLHSLRLAPLLAGWRGAPALDTAALAETVSRLSWLAHDAGPRLAELDANPVLVRAAGQGCTAVDARMLIAGPQEKP